MTDAQVIIVGAGPVGLVAALALSRGGVDCLVLEARDTPDTRLRASTFHPPTLDMLAELGLAEPLIAEGLITACWQLRQHESGESVEFDLGTIADVTAHPFRLQCEQHHLCALILATLRAEGRCRVITGCTVTGCRQDADGVTVTAEQAGAAAEYQAPWLVAADGAESAVRGALGLAYGGHTYEHASVLVTTDFPFHDHIPGLCNVTYCWSGSGPFSLLRLKHAWRASLYPGRGQDLAALAEAPPLRAALARIVPEAGDAELLGINPYRVHERSMARYRVGRVLFAGDAAHLNAPSGGMGMNGGIHDAINLAAKLGAVLAGADDALLDRYHRQRYHLATRGTIPQAADNRARMAGSDVASQLERLAALRAIAADPERHRAFALRSAMFSGLEEAEGIP